MNIRTEFTYDHENFLETLDVKKAMKIQELFDNENFDIFEHIKQCIEAIRFEDYLKILEAEHEIYWRY